MKNHIVFKFIAIVLCAASLLGAVGSVLGVVLLSSGGLYEVSVEEMVSAQVSQNSAELADWLAKNYASTELGGASEALVRSRYGSHWFDYNYDPAHYGYTITDGQGNELLSLNPELRDGENLYYRESFPITGKYIHVVSLESREEQQLRQEAEHAQILGEDIVLDEANSVVPAEGTTVESVIFADARGNTILEIWDDTDQTVVIEYGEGWVNTWNLQGQQPGFLFYSPEGYLVFHSAFNFDAFCGSLEEMEIYEAYFTFAGGQVRLRQDTRVGRVYLNDNGHLMFLSEPMEPVTDEETVAEATEETVPETIPETVPETVPETTAAYVETAPEVQTEASFASDIPQVTEETLPVYTGPVYVTEPFVETLPPETVPAETVPEETVAEETLPEETAPAETLPEPVIINGKSLNEYEVLTEDFYDSESDTRMTAKYVFLSLPELTVEVYMTEAALRNANSYRVLELLRDFRNYLLPFAAVCLLLFAVFAVYLCTAAGRKPGSEEVRAEGLNRVPLDLYLTAGGFAAACIIAVGGQLGVRMLDQDFYTGCGVLLGIGGFAAVLLVAFCFAFVAQIKTPDGFWWRNTLIGHFFRLFFRFSEWLAAWGGEKLLPLLGRLLHRLWNFTMRAFVWLYKFTEKAMVRLGDFLGKTFRWLGRLLHHFLKLLPVTWQWLLAGIVIIFCMMLVPGAGDFMTVVLLLIPIVIILYIAHCYGTLADATRRMSKGDLETKVDDSLMVGCFKESAADLNALAEVAVVAAEKQLKSERMKSELVTNVSHDIKTPLTSIINYVDLLKKPHTEAEGAQFLEVLDRQSQRLKKLLEDLMDMSKANTGNMQVEIATVDAVEAVTQALGEFSEKLERAQLTPVLRHTEDTLLMEADGRLVWRVMSNLLGNAVKYAMPGTRLYVDLMTLDGNVVISLKNISREVLNGNAEELMARFVRGDESRNTEGSGLGLNIARSLMDLQKGDLQLLVDGDLFKVTLTFPGTK